MRRQTPRVTAAGLCLTAPSGARASSGGAGRCGVYRILRRVWAAGARWSSGERRRYAQRIRADNLIVFHSTEEARNAGYRPCKVCEPPG